MDFLKKPKVFWHRKQMPLKHLLALVYYGISNQRFGCHQTATSLLLFKYPNSLPTLHYLSSFEPGSERLIEILKDKAEKGDLEIWFCECLLSCNHPARSQGPELLKDSSLRLMTYLLAESRSGGDSNQHHSISGKRRRKWVFNKVVAIALDKSEPIEKLKALAPLSGTDAQFCLAYYVAQLDEKEASSRSNGLENHPIPLQAKSKYHGGEGTHFRTASDIRKSSRINLTGSCSTYRRRYRRGHQNSW